MGVAYTDGPITASTLRADTTDHFVADLDVVLTAMGWTGSALADGWKYLLQSPQGLQAKLTVRVLGDTEPFQGAYPFVTLRFMNVAETVLGLEHKLAVGPVYDPIGYDVIANQCQVFIALHGKTTEVVTVSNRYAFQGGIPYVADPGGVCSASSGPDSTTMIWWSSSKGSQTQHIRSSRYATNSFDYCRNDVLVTRPSGNYTPYNGTLQLYPLTMTEDIDFWFFVYPRIVKYGNDEPLYLLPFIGWEYAIKGQLWDAFLASRDIAVDTETTITETGTGGNTRTGTWRTWNYYLGDQAGSPGTKFATLYLLIGPPVVVGGGGESNYAY